LDPETVVPLQDRIGKNGAQLCYPQVELLDFGLQSTLSLSEFTFGNLDRSASLRLLGGVVQESGINLGVFLERSQTEIIEFTATFVQGCDLML
jgi:hypothetical protein